MSTLFLYIKNSHEKISKNCGKIAAAERKIFFAAHFWKFEKVFRDMYVINYITGMVTFSPSSSSIFDSNLGHFHLIKLFCHNLYNS